MKAIEVTLLDDTVNGKVLYEMKSFNIVGYKFKRDQLKEASTLEKIKNSGVYLLFGDGNKIYVGQGAEPNKGVLGRLEIHNRNEKKYWWTDTAVFVSSDNFLGSTHVKYLEKALYDEVKKIGRFELDNKQTPGGQILTQKEEVESKEFMNNIMLLVTLMGYKAFEKVKAKTDVKDEDILYITKKGEEVASGAVTDDGFIIFKGSKILKEKISKKISKSIREYVKKERASEDIENGEFVKNHTVSSPSMAASIIYGTNKNGRILWKNKEGKTLKDLSAQ